MRGPFLISGSVTFLVALLGTCAGWTTSLIPRPTRPSDLTTRSWKYVVRKTVREFTDDQCTDLAAALTYYAVLALFPAVIALLSLVGLVGPGDEDRDHAARRPEPGRRCQAPRSSRR